MRLWHDSGTAVIHLICVMIYPLNTQQYHNLFSRLGECSKTHFISTVPQMSRTIYYLPCAHTAHTILCLLCHTHQDTDVSMQFLNRFMVYICW